MTQEQIQINQVQTLRLPAIAMRGLVMFPKMVLHFDVARKKSILALNQAMQGNQKIFLVTQKNTRVENPGKDDLYTVGVVAKVKQILKAQSEVMRVVVEGQYRARMCELVKDTPFYEVMCEELPMLPVEQGKQVTIDAYMRVVKDLFEEYCYYAPKMPKELVVNIIGSEDPVYISEYLAQNLGFSIEDKQMILEESSIRKRMEILSSLLRRENEILSIERSIAERVKEQVDRNQKEYYLREQLKAIHAELGEDEDSDQEIEQYRQKLKEMAPDEETEKKLTEEINKLSKMMYNSQEAMVSRNYLDTVFSLPWNHMTQERLDIHQAQEQLDADHYGLQKVKERILEILAVRKLEPNIKGQIICLVGPPGVGKTSIAKSIAAAMGRNYVRMSLRDVRDVTEISILQGRNSKDDVDYFDHAIVECSADGKTWKTLTGELDKQYIIHWQGAPEKARYVRLKRLDSKRTNYASVRSFDVNPLRPENMGFSLEADSLDKTIYAFDNNLATSYKSTKTLTFGVKENVKAYTLLMNRLSAPLKCIQLDKKGKVVSETMIETPFARIELANKNVAKIRLEGVAEVFEIVAID